MLNISMDFASQLKDLANNISANQLQRHISGSLREWVLTQTEKYNPKNIMESVYIVLNGAPPYCECGEKKKFNTFVLGYRQCCILGNDCTFTQKRRRSNYEKTMLQKYGTLSPDVSQEKRKQTILEKYGVEHAAQSKQARLKLSQARKNRSDEEQANIIKKTKQTMKERYGVEHHMQLETQKQKLQKTNLAKYGVCFPLQAEKIKEKQKKTIAEQSKEKKEKALKRQKLTFVEKYGVDAASKIPVPVETLEILSSQEKFVNFVKNKTREQVLEELNIANHTLYLYAKKYCAASYFSKPLISKFEKEVIDFVKSIYSKTIQIGDRNILDGQEIDIYLPESKIGVECSGLYWHSEISAGRTEKYHSNKFQLCKNYGIKLITLFEDEWNFKNQQVKNRIKHLLGSTSIYARNCTIKEISANLANDFVNEHHSQGVSSTPINLGLFYNDELYAVMTFGTPRYAKKYQFELVRFCSKNQVLGAASKLFKFFVKKYNPNKVVTYSDNSWGLGSVYEKMGFQKNSDTVGYWYTDYKKRYNRLNFQKHKIKHLVEKADQKTEWQIMQELGYDRIWDCGQVTWVYDINSNK